MNEKFGSEIIILKLNIFFLTFQHFRIDHNAPSLPPQFGKTVMFPMNDFPVIGDHVLRTGFWDRQEANIASRYKEMYGVELFLR